MLSHRRINFLLAALLVAALLIFLGGTYNIGKTTSAAAPLTAKLLRRHDKTKLKPSAAELDSLRSHAQAKEERQLENAIPKHVPITIKIKAEKEKAFKDLSNEHWFRDLEIEVKNTGTKPIYFLVLVLDMPDTNGPDGNRVGYDLHYGRTDLIELAQPLRPVDVPIKPGDTYTFTMAERFARGWERIVRDNHVRQPKKVRVLFQFINFGDGTGLDTTTAVPISQPEESSNGTKARGNEGKTIGRKDGIDKRPSVAFGHSEDARLLPAYLPAKFLTASSNPLTTDAGSEPDVCCPGTSCTWAKKHSRDVSVQTSKTPPYQTL